METFFPDFEIILEVKKDAEHISHNLLRNSWQESSPGLKSTELVSQGKSQRISSLHTESSWYQSTEICKGAGHSPATLAPLGYRARQCL